MTTQLLPQSTLMQPIEYNGQTYYTSQYFHAHYIAGHSETTKKYARHADFTRLIRNIESFQLYTERGDIVVLKYDKEQADSGTQNLRSLFKSNGYNPIMLLNATAQLELSHHLDDELSKQMAVAHSVMATTGKSAMLAAQQDMQAWLAIASMMQAPQSIALVEASKQIRRDHGVDLTPLLTSSSALDDIPQEDMMLEPTALGQLLGMSGKEMNQLLAAHGLQVKINGVWTPTDKAHGLWSEHLWVRGNKSGYNKKWNVDHIRTLISNEDV